MKNYLQRASEINERINILSTYSDNTKSITRIFGTKAFVECSDKIASWMRDAGLETSIDNMGNVRGKWCSKNPDAKILVIGSHFDTVLNAGKFEGTLGILAGLDIVEYIISQNITLPFHLELIAFSGDAGIRFNYSFLGSEVVTGIFHDRLLEIKDAGGNTLSKVLHTLNYDPSKLSEDAISPENWLGYYEMHIEQGNLLVENNLPVCVVSSISGQKRIEIKFTGKSGHAGTVRMNLRKDALCAAAKFILFVEKYASREKGNLLATVGKISIERAASNVIPGIVNCSVDIRSNDSKILSEAYEMIYAECEKICDKRNIYFEWKLIQEIAPVNCNKKLRKILTNSISEKNIQPINLQSGATHDAAVISYIAPVAMLFVKCFKTIAEGSIETVEINDIASALEVSEHFILQLASPTEKITRKKEK